MVSDVNINSVLTQQQKTDNATKQLSTDFAQFLNLLTVQLQNQDPLSPMDSTEFTNQLVAFSGVEQQINSNQKLDDLISLQLGNSMGQALGYVGMDANYVSGEAPFDGETPIKVKYALEAPAASATFRIEDESGKTVFEKKLEDLTVGQKDFTWDGKMKDGTMADAGTYTLRIDALDGDGKAIKSTTVVSGRVRGVETQGGIMFLLIGDRAVSLGNVINVALPADPEPDPAPDDGGTDA